MLEEDSARYLKKLQVFSRLKDLAYCCRRNFWVWVVIIPSPKLHLLERYKRCFLKWHQKYLLEAILQAYIDGAEYNGPRLRGWPDRGRPGQSGNLLGDPEPSIGQ